MGELRGFQAGERGHERHGIDLASASSMGSNVPPALKWIEHGLDKEYGMVLSEFIFYLLQDGCIPKAAAKHPEVCAIMVLRSP